ncbi:MAG: SGNH/GDSL hydrolase family protein [Paracoccaceae bacterium]
MIRTIIFAVTSVFIATASNASTFTSYLAFGDSLSDDGKGLTIFNPPPYSGGRFSTGPVWTEILADEFISRGLNTANFALGGATAGDTNTQDANYLFFDTLNPDPNAPDLFDLGTFQRQIDFFTASAGAPPLGDNPLVSVLFGANDITQGGSPVQAALDVISGITALNDLDSSLDSFLVSNLPNLALTPGGASNPFSSAATAAFNTTLETGLASLELTRGLDIIRLDQEQFLQDIIDNPSALGLTNVTDACVQVPDPTTNFAGSNCTITGFTSDGTPIFDLSIAETYLFLDDNHPTGPVQNAFGEFAIDALGSSTPGVVPLPATLPLMLAGFGVFALARRRKTA